MYLLTRTYIIDRYFILCVFSFIGLYILIFIYIYVYMYMFVSSLFRWHLLKMMVFFLLP